MDVSSPIYILRIPPELWDYILSFIPEPHLQRTALSLLSVFPNVSISDRHLWKNLVVARSEQLPALYLIIRELDKRRQFRPGLIDDDSETEDEDTWINFGPALSTSFEMRSWKGNADALVNILHLLPNLEAIRLRIGTNFNPEHLEDIFLTPRPKLQSINLRFRPYVNTVSYHQFLSGIYYDTFIDLLASWTVTPANQPLRSLSLVQDVPPRHLVDPRAPRPAENNASKEDAKEKERVQGKGGYTGHGPFNYLSEALQSFQPKIFAQPIVFFNTMCITRLSLSLLTKMTTHLRLRIPQKDIISPITTSALSFPSLQFLDVSTSNIRLHTNIPTLLRTYPNLQHLIMDHTNLFGFLGNDKERGKECCHELGRLLVMSGMNRGKEVERSIGNWEKEESFRATRRRDQDVTETSNTNGPQTTPERSVSNDIDRMADRLEALTTMDYNLNASSRERRRGVRPMGISSFSIRSSNSSSSTNNLARTALSNATTSSHHDNSLSTPTSINYVLPSIPVLRSVSLGGEAILTSSQRKEWTSEFKRGWKEGLEKIVEWALGGVGERYERSRRKAEKDRVEWEKWLTTQATGGRQTDSPLEDRSTGAPVTNGKGKGKAHTISSSKISGSAVPKPPPQVNLYRFPTPAERASLPPFDPSANPTSQLVLISGDSTEDWRSTYADLLSRDVSCVFCTVPEDPTGGPLRRGGENLVRLSHGGTESAGSGSVSGSTLPSGVGTPRSWVGGYQFEEEDQVEDNVVDRHPNGCGHAIGKDVWEDWGD
ncbi:hypothetical protein [Phaffia rhodozyma]|uniref:F-box domain-containing protein n=1 Tax=Phaffia rhodozyma TaxID=264483 RepID=A0A0F7SHE8_PHARH|nr:hypothetical protein [Phaffia rhodozyma]